MDFFKQDSSTREEMGLLAVLDALADEKQVTQRELSRRTGLNLKKVNYCLHKLLEKGYVKFQRAVVNPDKRAYLYILTPAGFRAKSHLSYRFLKYTLDFYNQVEMKLRRSIDRMAASGVKKVVLYGISDVTKIILDLMERHEAKVIGVLDDNCVDNSYHGVAIIEAEDLLHMEWDGILITNLEGLDVIDAQLCDMGVPENRVWRLS